MIPERQFFHLVDAKGAACKHADRVQMPLTVFYHPDYANTYTGTLADVLKDEKTELFVTYLPSQYFEPKAAEEIW